jgi:ubiquinone/menaquinone biosynthesis C-methylase UbiE
MDKYTEKTRLWLDSRFRACDEEGIFFAHQPIYGLRKGHCEGGLIDRYVRTFQIMRLLSHLKFGSLLDVGGAEGYKACMVNKLFGAAVKNSDISEEACRRSAEIFGLESFAADIHRLPCHDNEFDIVLCSETLEHVTDYRQAVNELLRVARTAVVITIPHEPQHITTENAAREVPHGHIHSFDLASFSYLSNQGYSVLGSKHLSPLIKTSGLFIEGRPIEYREAMKYPPLFYTVYNSIAPLLRRLFDERTFACLVTLDKAMCRLTPWYGASSFIILKDAKAYSKKASRHISALRIIRFAVPYHYLRI